MIDYGSLQQRIHRVYEEGHTRSGMVRIEDYCAIRQVHGASILTICKPSQVEAAYHQVRERIKGKKVVEIGAGVGLLSLAMAERAAKSVLAIEPSPWWSGVYMDCVAPAAPPNLHWFQGTAEDWMGLCPPHIHSGTYFDVAVCCTLSEPEQFRALGQSLALETIMVHQEE